MVKRMKMLAKLFTFLIIFISVFSAAHAAPVFNQDSIILSDIENGFRTSQINGEFQIKNQNDIASSITLDGLVLTNTNGDNLQIEAASDLGLFQPREGKDVEFSIDLSSNPTYGVYSANIIATNALNEQTILPVTLTVEKYSDVRITTDSKELTIDDNNNVTLSITNLGNNNDPYMISLLNLLRSSDSYSLNTPAQTVTIAPGASVNLTFDIYTQADLEAGLYRYQVIADQQNNNFNKNVELTGVRLRKKVSELTINPDDIAVPVDGNQRAFNFSFNISNTGEIDLTDIDLEVDSFDSSLEYTDYPSKFDLARGQTQTFNIQANSYKLIELRDLGNVEVTYDSKTKRSKILPEKKNMLRIDEVVMTVAGKRDRIKNSGDDFDDEIKPGQDFTVEIEICNDYDKDSDVDIDSIDVIAVIANIDDGSDLDDDETTDFRIAPDECRTQEIEFDQDYIPYDAEEGKYKLEIEVSGRDDFDYDQEAKFTVDLDVDRERHELLLKKFSASPKVVQACFGNSVVGLTARVFNIGDNDEEGYVRFYSDQLNFEQERSFEVDHDSDNEYSGLVNYEFGRDALYGTYTFYAELYRDNDFEDVAEIEVIYEECAANGLDEQSLYEQNLRLLEELNGKTTQDTTSDFEQIVLPQETQFDVPSEDDERKQTILLITAVGALFVLAFALMILLMI